MPDLSLEELDELRVNQFLLYNWPLRLLRVIVFGR